MDGSIHRLKNETDGQVSTQPNDQQDEWTYERTNEDTSPQINEWPNE